MRTLYRVLPPDWTGITNALCPVLVKSFIKRSADARLLKLPTCTAQPLALGTAGFGAALGVRFDELEAVLADGVLGAVERAGCDSVGGFAAGRALAGSTACDSGDA